MQKLILNKSDKYKAVFAGKNFKKGELIVVFKGKIFDYDDIVDGSYIDEHSLQVGESTYIGPSGGFDDYINHSCNPNSGIKTIGKEPTILAIRNIKKGEEITWDYSTSMAENHWKMKCNCGENDCRKIIKDFSSLPKIIQQKYKKLGVVLDYILKNS